MDEDVVSYAFNAAAWEQQANNRGEVLAMGLWDGYLSEKLDLVTIQLSENCSDTTTLEYDFREMVEYVQEKIVPMRRSLLWMIFGVTKSPK